MYVPILHWQSQPTVDCTPAGNLLLAAGILFCGLTFTSIANLADVLNLAMFCEERYYGFQKKVCVSCCTHHLHKAKKGHSLIP